MKRGLLLALIAFMAVNFAGSAGAIPVFKTHFEKMYVDKEKNKEFAAKVKAEKCNVCHYGKSKKNKNDYGLALSKLIKKKEFSGARVKAEPDKVKAELDKAFKKVGEVKKKSGKTFGELIKAGELPGTAPEEKK